MQVTLRPGQKLELGYPELTIKGPQWSEKTEEPVLRAGPGKYKVSLDYRLDGQRPGDWKGVLSTGQVEFEIAGDKK